MLTVLQQRKITRYFNVVDKGSKGFITEEDIYLLSLRMAQKRGIEEDSEDWKPINKNADQIWNDSINHSISGDPDKVYLVDWLVKHHEILSQPESRKIYLENIANDVFALFHSNDSIMYLEHYIEMISCFGVETEIAEWAFNILDRKNNGWLDLNDYLQIIEEFFLSDEKDTPGNYFFGPF